MAALGLEVIINQRLVKNKINREVFIGSDQRGNSPEYWNQSNFNLPSRTCV